MTPQVEHGFIITKPDGRPWDEYLYPTREAAERIAMFNSTLRVYPARRVFSLRQATATTVTGRRDLIIDRGET
ncbi:MAG: hypothetical protein ACTHNH_08540 [Mesorhizobium sp.]